MIPHLDNHDGAGSRKLPAEMMAIILATATLAVAADASSVLRDSMTFNELGRARRDTITFSEVTPRGCCRNAAGGEGPSKFAGQLTKPGCEAACAADEECTGYEWQEFRGNGETAACRLRLQDDFAATSNWQRCHCYEKFVIADTGAPTTTPPTVPPTNSPTPGPTASPTPRPTTSSPTPAPTVSPTPGPTVSPTPSPTTSSPTAGPTASPAPFPTPALDDSGSGSSDDGSGEYMPFSELPGQPSGFCRAADGTNPGSYKYLTGDDGTITYDQCVTVCLMDAVCAGFEYRIADKCEFKRSDQIQAAEFDPRGTTRCFLRNP